MQAHTAPCGYQPRPYVLLRRSADDAPVAVTPKAKGIRAMFDALRILFKHWARHDRSRPS